MPSSMSVPPWGGIGADSHDSSVYNFYYTSNHNVQYTDTLPTYGLVTISRPGPLRRLPQYSNLVHCVRQYRATY